MAIDTGRDPKYHKVVFMKAWKNRTFVIISAMVILTFVFTACNNGKKRPVSPPEQPQYRESQIELHVPEYNERYKITVQGNFTREQWDGIVSRVGYLINQVYRNEHTGIREKAYFIVTFQNNDAVIIVEETSEYPIYKIAGNRTLHLNFNSIYESNMLFQTRKAVIEMVRSKPGPEAVLEMLNLR